MKLRLMLLEWTTFVALTTTLGATHAGEGIISGKSCRSTGQARNCPTTSFCPDDYCRKAEPSLPCPTQGCAADCFSRKPLPCPPKTSGCVTCDDYIPKCFPVEPCPFRPYPVTTDACAKARWYEQPFRSRTAGMSILRN